MNPRTGTAIGPVVALGAAFGLALATPLRAASLQSVGQSTWGTAGLPSYVNMYIYVPDSLAARPPILVASHHCQGTGPGTFNETKSTLVPLADENGFIMIFPEATGHNCWDVGSAKSLTHDGGGDTHAIAQMVRYTIAQYGADSSRVYAFGGSSGGMMTQALMGVYPDLFRAGVAVSGATRTVRPAAATIDVAGRIVSDVVEARMSEAPTSREEDRVGRHYPTLAWFLLLKK